MLKIYDIETAQQTILQRKPLNSMTYPPAVLAGTERLFGAGVTPSQAVAQILASVQSAGDAALRHWSKLLDRIEIETFQIPKLELERAYASLSEELRLAMQTAAQRIRLFHALQPLPNWETTTLGGRLGQRVTPVERAGVYVPGGTAPLPSSLLMSVIPAQVAGVKQISVCTPPNPHPAILGAAYLCGIEQVFQIAALAKQIKYEVTTNGGHCVLWDAGDAEDTILYESSMTKGRAMMAVLRGARRSGRSISASS